MATRESTFSSGMGGGVFDALTAELEQIYSLAGNSDYRRYAKIKQQIAVVTGLALVLVIMLSGALV